MAGPVGDVLASGQVVISSVKTLSGLKLSVTVRSGARKPDISTVDAVKKMLLDARSITYVDPARGTIGSMPGPRFSDWDSVSNSETRRRWRSAAHARRSLPQAASQRSTWGHFFNDALVPASSA